MTNDKNKLYNCMYKIDDILLSGGHYLLVDDIKPYIDKNIGFYSNIKNKIDDKYILLVCDYEKSIKIEDNNIYTIYHLVLEGEKKNYGIYINNNILSESTNEINFLNNYFTIS